MAIGKKPALCLTFELLNVAFQPQVAGRASAIALTYFWLHFFAYTYANSSKTDPRVGSSAE